MPFFSEGKKAPDIGILTKQCLEGLQGNSSIQQKLPRKVTPTPIHIPVAQAYTRPVCVWCDVPRCVV